MEYIENICCTNDGQLICITTKYAILLFETTKLAFVFKIDRLPMGLTNKITNFKFLNNTRILGFIYNEKSIEEEQKEKLNKSDPKKRRASSKNLIDPDQNLIIIDIEYNRILGKIKIKGRIDDFELTQNFIIISKKSLNKVLLFKTITLEYFTTLENVNLGKIRYNDNLQIEDLSKDKTKNNLFIFNSNDSSSTKDKDNSDNNQNKINIANEKEKNSIESNKNNSQSNHYCILAYQDFKNKKEIVLIEYILDISRNNIISHKKRTFIPNFNAVGVKFIYLLENYILISSNIGNKLHVYDVHNFTLLNCIYLGDFPYELSGIRLNSDKTIMSIITNNKYVKLYKINQVGKKCTCLWHDDTKVSFTKKRSIFAVFKHKINSGKTPLLCKFKINYEEKDQLNNHSFVFFDENDNKLMWVVQKNCSLKKFSFDPNIQNIIKLEKNLKISEFYRYDMEQEMKE